MDQIKSKKIKPCIVKLTRYNGMEDPDVIRDRILDKRMRKCHVLLRRFDIEKFLQNSACGVYGQFKVRHCCVRLPRLNLEVFDALERSSPSVLPECENKSETGGPNESERILKPISMNHASVDATAFDII